MDSLGTVKPWVRPLRLRMRVNMPPVSGGASNPNVLQNNPGQTAGPDMASEAPVRGPDLHLAFKARYTPVVYRTQRRPSGQGTAVYTVRADQGDYVKMVSDVPYSERNKPQPFNERPARGRRAMHTSSLVIPIDNATDYTTTLMQAQAKVRPLDPEEVVHPCLSQHRSFTQLTHVGQEATQPWQSLYKANFVKKDSGTSSEILYPIFNNKMCSTDGEGIRRIMKSVDLPHSHVTQYTRVHNKLGLVRGPGVSRPFPVRREYNVLTGEDVGTAWQEDNKRISGNRVLYDVYRNTSSCKLFG